MELYNYYLQYDDELFHHGTKGMKWGIRRFQNKDGSLTAAGKKRRSLGKTIHDYKVNKKRKASLEKAREAKANKLKEEEKRKKAYEEGRLSPKKMTDDELKKSISRLQAEQSYQEALLETRPMRRLMNKTWKEAIVPGITEAGKELVKKSLIEYGGKALGLDKKEAKSAVDIAKDEYQLLDYKKKIEDLKNPKKNLDDIIKELDDETKYREAVRKNKNAKDSDYMTKKTESEKAEMQSKINKVNKGGVLKEDQDDDDNTRANSSNKTESSNANAKTGEKWTKQSTSTNATTTELSTMVINQGKAFVDGNNGRHYTVDYDGTIEYVD